MSTCIRYEKIKKTRKIHHCTGCGELIKQEEPAYAWTSVDDVMFTAYLHEKCGELVENHCFNCKKCGEDGFQDEFIKEAHLCGCECETVKGVYGELTNTQD